MEEGTARLKNEFARDAVAVLVLLAVNILIAAKLFSVEYLADLESIEGTFLSIAQQVAAHPQDLLWWPYWDCGLPFQNTYLPLLHLMVAAYSRLTHLPVPLAYHQVCAALYCLGPVAVYALARVLTGFRTASLLAALVFSLFSPCAWLVPAIRTDLGSTWHVRRLQIMTHWGEGPHIGSLAFLPLAVLFLYRSLVQARTRDRVLAGVFAGLTVLTNAFGAVILGVVCLCLLATIRTDRFWPNAGVLAAIGLLAYLWISPLAPPSVLAAIRMNSPTVDGDYRYTPCSVLGVLSIAVACAVFWWASRRLPAYLRFLLLYTACMAGIVLLGSIARIYVLPQPHRYQIAMDLGICLTFVFGMQTLLRSRSRRLQQIAVAVVLIACLLQLVHARRYARQLIQPVEIKQTAPYRLATWMDSHMQGRRVMIAGPHSFLFNLFTDTPQMHGGHDPMLPNFLMRIATFVIYSGMNAGQEDAAISQLWLQALGAHAISVPEGNTPFANPRKFEGVLPVLWRMDNTTVYGVPARTGSLAHLIPREAVVSAVPVHGLDVAGVRAYAAALNDASLPEANMTWQSRHAAQVQLRPRPGTVLSVQMTYHPGWRARVGDTPVSIKQDGLGFLVLQPECEGPCTVTLAYDGGPELRWTAGASLLVMLGVALSLGRSWLRERREPNHRPMEHAH